MTTKQLFRFTAGEGLEALLKRNAEWAKKTSQAHPALFPTNAQGQSPQILWIGCADSRAGEGCLDLLPGEVFTHRNIANVIPYSDISSLSIIQLAVDIIKVRHIVVCGHYDCAGVWSCFSAKKLGGEIDSWLRHVREVKSKHNSVLDQIPDVKDKCDKLVELNVAAQVTNLKRNDRVSEAMRSRGLQVHGVVYDVSTGLLKPVDVPADKAAQDYVISDDGATVGH
jgi:carbonic anhydrase